MKTPVLLGQYQFAFTGPAKRIKFARMLDQHLAAIPEQISAANVPAVRIVSRGERRRFEPFIAGCVEWPMFHLGLVRIKCERLQTTQFLFVFH
jgi:hypothetical protein